MKKLRFILLSMLCLGAMGVSAQMSDQQIVDYVKSSASAGKGEKQIATELVAKGVSMQQLERLREQYEGSTKGNASTTENQYSSVVRAESGAAISADAFSAVAADMAPTAVAAQGGALNRIYGHDIFTSRALTFEPNANLPTPENYVLGPGDEVIIEIWGANEASIRQTISPEGRITVAQIGPLYLNGLTIKKANDLVRQAFAQKYAGVMGDEPMSDVSLTLGSIRTIQVNIFGEVSVPGTYRLSSFATVFHALYRAGGVTDLGTVRTINVIRNGKTIANVDIYPFVKTGDTKADIRLQDGDIINVPLYNNVVDINGNVKKPMYYELKEGETLAQLIDYAGGFTGDAYTQEVKVTRSTGREREILNIAQANFSSFVLEPGDVVAVSGMLDRYANRVEVTGSVFRPGIYELGREIFTVKDLVDHAEGLLEDAFTGRARILRHKEDFTPEVISFNLGDLLAGRVADISLKKNDVLVVSSIHELNALGTLTIDGMVKRPGTYTFAENMSIEDLILQAGGLREGASSVRVEVSRRILNPASEMPSDTLAKVYTFPLDLDLIETKAAQFLLEPYDYVSIRKSPDYNPQSVVSIQGEVAFPGNYTMISVGDRLSDLVSRSGGITQHAYLKGATLVRTMTAEERSQMSTTMDFISLGSTRDSLDVSRMLTSNQYTVAINLEKALEQPGSEFDVILREGDRLVVPEYLSTVKIQGDVLRPNTVTYKQGAKAKYYIKKTGGYGVTAKKSKAYIVYMNGDVAKANATHKVEPGCQIIVPSKKEKKTMDFAQSMSLASTATSITTAMATVAALLMK